MVIQETHIEIARKMHHCRFTAKRFFKEEYEGKIKLYKDIIKGVRDKNNLDIIPAVLQIMEDKEISENEMAVMMFMAATIELIEIS